MDEIFSNNATPFAFRVNYLSHQYTGPLSQLLETKHGLLWQEWVVLFCLASNERRCWRAGDVAQVTNRPKNSISRAVKKLVAQGYIVRHDHPKDGRAQTLNLTNKGRDFYDKFLPSLLEAERAIYSALSPEEAEIFLGFLDRVVARADEIGGADL